MGIQQSILNALGQISQGAFYSKVAGVDWRSKKAIQKEQQKRLAAKAEVQHLVDNYGLKSEDAALLQQYKGTYTSVDDVVNYLRKNQGVNIEQAISANWSPQELPKEIEEEAAKQAELYHEYDDGELVNNQVYQAFDKRKQKRLSKRTKKNFKTGGKL